MGLGEKTVEENVVFSQEMLLVLRVLRRFVGMENLLRDCYN